MTDTTVVVRRPRILVADDQPDILEALRLLLKGEDYEVETALSPAGVLLAVQSGDLDAALIDLNYARDTTSGDEGIDLLGRIRAADATLPVSVMTAWAVSTARWKRCGAGRTTTSRSRGATTAWFSPCGARWRWGGRSARAASSRPRSIHCDRAPGVRS